MDAAAFSVLPLKRYAEFHGRSRRTELISFYVLFVTANVALGFAAVGIGIEAHQWIQAGFTLFLLCPTFALAVRRLHDTGRSGWWLLLALPAAAVGAWEFLARPGPWALTAHLQFPWWIEVPLGLSGAALAVLLLWDDDPETNRYGPNPRFGPVGEPA